jgi:hypothetical protein
MQAKTSCTFNPSRPFYCLRLPEDKKHIECVVCKHELTHSPFDTIPNRMIGENGKVQDFRNLYGSGEFKCQKKSHPCDYICTSCIQTMKEKKITRCPVCNSPQRSTYRIPETADKCKMDIQAEVCTVPIHTQDIHT